MSASPLEALQKRFVGAIIDSSDFAAAVTGGGKLSAEEAVAVYRGGYPVRLIGALGETFEACWRVLGDDDFFAVCRAFIARNPSTSHNLSDYGTTFPDFLDAPPFLGDLARFEWTFKELFHARPHMGLSAAELAKAVKPDSKLILGGAHRFLSLRHSVYGIWKRDRSDDTPLKDSDWEGAQRLVLYKNGGNEIFVTELSEAEFTVLQNLRLGLAQALAGGIDEAATKKLFAFLATSGLVAEVR
jgi:hypothetical protein